jgi:hypothetical protein
MNKASNSKIDSILENEMFKTKLDMTNTSVTPFVCVQNELVNRKGSFKDSGKIPYAFLAHLS